MQPLTQLYLGRIVDLREVARDLVEAGCLLDVFAWLEGSNACVQPRTQLYLGQIVGLREVANDLGRIYSLNPPMEVAHQRSTPIDERHIRQRAVASTLS